MRQELKYQILFLLLAISVLNVNGKKYQVIKNDSIRLSQILNNDEYNIKEPISIISDLQRKYILNSFDENMTNDQRLDLCLNAFFDWCDRFLCANREYIVFRDRSAAPEKSDVWQSKGDCGYCFTEDGSEIIIDPFYNTIGVNEYLLNNKILISLNNGESFTGEYGVNIDAIVPYNGKYYEISNMEIFYRKIDFKKFKTTDIKEICKIFSQAISENQSAFFDDKGFYVNSSLYPYLNWTFPNIMSIRIKEIDLNPTSEKITIAKLFYSLFSLK